MRRLRKKKSANTLSNKKESSFFPAVQTKLSVGKAGDPFEVEADKMADKVTQKETSTTKNSVQKKGAEEEEVQTKSMRLQKMETEEEQPVQKVEKEEEEPVQKQEEEEEPVQMKEMEEEEPVQKQAEEEEEPIQTKEVEEEEPVQKQAEEEEPVQAKEAEEEEPVQKQEEEEPVQAKKEEEEAVQKQEEEEEAIQAKANNNAKSSSKLESTLKGRKGRGMKMDPKTKAQMESGFGVDFGGVNIHTDSSAISMTKELGAQAFTHGSDIYFNEGKYNPTSSQGKHLLAHELTHTIQQGAAKKASPKLQKKNAHTTTNHSKNISKSPTKIQKKDSESSDLQRMREILGWITDVPETEVITLFGVLSRTEANIVLSDATMKSQALWAMNNSEIYQAMNACKGSLSLKLSWMISEGTHIDYIREVILNSSSGDYQNVLDNTNLKADLFNAVGASLYPSLEEILKKGVPEIEPTDDAMGQCIVEKMKSINEGHTAQSGIHYPNSYRQLANAYDPSIPETIDYKPFHDFWSEDYADGYANPEYWTKNNFMDWTLREDKLASEAIQDWLKGLTIADCASAIVAIELDTLRRTIGDVKFDRLFSKVDDNQPLDLLHVNQSSQESSLAEVFHFDTESHKNPGTVGKRNVELGEWHYFFNHPAHILKHPSSFYQGENAIYMGEVDGVQQWSGLGVKSVSEIELLSEMAKQYNLPRNNRDYWYLVSGYIEDGDYEGGKDYKTIYEANKEKVSSEYREDSGQFPTGEIDAIDIVYAPEQNVQGEVRKGGFVPGAGKKLNAKAIEKLR